MLPSEIIGKCLPSEMIVKIISKCSQETLRNFALTSKKYRSESLFYYNFKFPENPYALNIPMPKTPDEKWQVEFVLKLRNARGWILFWILYQEMYRLAQHHIPAVEHIVLDLCIKCKLDDELAEAIDAGMDMEPQTILKVMEIYN